MPAAVNPTEYRYSPTALIGLSLLGVGMTALCGLVALRIYPTVRPGSYAEYNGYFGFVFFGMCTAIAIWRFATSGGPVVTLTETGITDVRLAAEEIPWAAIRRVSTFAILLQKFLVLDVDPTVERTLTLTRVVRWSRWANGKLGVEGLSIAAQALDVDFRTLRDRCEAYVRGAHASP